MSRVKEDKSEATKARNAAAMRRLEELLRDPGPGIVVRRVEAADQFARMAGEQPPPAPQVPEAVVPAAPVPSPVDAAPPAPVSVTRPMPASAAPVVPAPAAVKAKSVATDPIALQPVPNVPPNRMAVATVDRIARKKNLAETARNSPVPAVHEPAAFETLAGMSPEPSSAIDASLTVEPSSKTAAPQSFSQPGSEPAGKPVGEPVAEAAASDVQPALRPPMVDIAVIAAAPEAKQAGFTLSVAAVQIAPVEAIEPGEPIGPARPQEIETAGIAPALSISVSRGLAIEAASAVEPAEQTPLSQAAPVLEATIVTVLSGVTPDDLQAAAATAVPNVSSQQRIRERLQRAAKIQAPVPAPARPADPAPVPHVAAAPVAAAQPTIAIPGPAPVPPLEPERPAAKVSVEPTPVAAAPRVAHGQATKAESARKIQAPMADHLKHMPASVRGRLASYLEGKLTQAPAAAAAEKVESVEGVSSRAVGRPGDGELRTALLASRKPFLAAGLFSFVINILMLAGPLFMLQVYDRVLGSGSISTLVALTVLTSAMYGIIALLELARTRIIVRMGTEIDQRVSDRIFRASLRKTLSNPSAAIPALRELDNVRQFAGSQGPLTFFDAPWTPIYLGVIGLVHWALGLTAVIGAASLMVITWLSERRSRGPLTEASKAMNRSIELAETGQRNAESLTAMGMIGAYRDRWQEANWDSLSWQMQAADRLGSMAAFSKGLRLFLQSLMLAIGAGLAVKGEISAGSIIAGTIIFGRALAPIEQAISHWKGYLKARESYAKLDKLLRTEPEPPQRTALPAPRGRLEVESLRVAAPDTQHLILTSVNFRIDPGQMLAVIGPSASGKSTLARTLVGLWQPVAGSIRFDGARLEQWDPEALGAHIGFLPQNVELFAGSVRDNIARFKRDASDDEVTEAARAAHAHDLIMALPQGYETPLGAFGTYLSSGQRQRIALSRALFRHPALVVLDEPNSNLDRDGDEALAAAIDGMRKRGQAVILVSHRVQAIGKADLLLYLERGAQRAFGPRREVMKLFQPGGDGAAVKAQPASKSGSA